MQYNTYRRDWLWAVEALLKEEFKNPVPVTTRGRIREVQQTDNQYKFTLYSLFAQVPSYISIRELPQEINPTTLKERLISAALDELKLSVQGIIHNREFKVEIIQFPEEELQLVSPEQIEQLSRQFAKSLDVSLIGPSVTITIFD